MRLLPVLRGLLLIACAGTPALAAGLADRGKDTAAHARCIARSIESGKPADPTDAGACWKKAADALDAALAVKGTAAGSKLAAAVRFASTCGKALEFSKPPPFDDAPSTEDGWAPDAAYFQTFIQLMPPRGEAVARCYADLQKAPGAARTLKGGRITVELTMAPTGRAAEVVLVETTGVSGVVVMCVVDALCGLSAKPAKKTFYIELPFSFEKPKRGRRIPRGLQRR